MVASLFFLLPKSWWQCHRPRVTELESTTSACATESVRRKHVFEIKGYRGLLSRTGGAGECVRSAAFAVGGYDWTVLYYPRGCLDVSVFKQGPAPDSGTRTTVAAVLPSELSSDLAKLLQDSGGGSHGAPPPDVSVVVGSESFGAHSFVLWARCPKLYDRVTAWKILVLGESEVRPAVFKALLHYIYTDSLPAMGGGLNKTETLRGLLAAADQYGIQRLKLMCETTLCASLDAGTVAATLVLAERLQCPTLRRACTQFIAAGRYR